MTEERGGIIQLSWDDVMEFCKRIALRLDKEYSPDFIIGIALGGVIPAAILASILRVEFHPVKITRRRKNIVMRSVPQLVTPMPDEVSGKRVLIVDDTVKSGDTILLAVREAQKKGAKKVKSCALWVQPDGFHPTYYCIESDGVVMLPWNEEVLVGGKFVLHPEYQAAIDAMYNPIR